MKIKCKQFCPRSRQLSSPAGGAQGQDVNTSNAVWAGLMMEEGQTRMRNFSDSTDNSTEQSDINSQVLDLVIDPLTDFQLSECNSVPTSPEQSYKLKPSPPVAINVECEETNTEEVLLSPSTSLHSPQNLLHNILDSQTRGSDGSLASSAEHSFDGGGGGYSGSSAPHRLAVASVHRFGHHPPCAGSPHDLASCPACPASATTTAATCPYGRGKKCVVAPTFDLVAKCDALKTLAEASSALALTETLIGPLGIPPVSQVVLSEVVSSMEKKGCVTLPKSNDISRQSSSSVTAREMENQGRPCVKGTTGVGQTTTPSIIISSSLDSKETPLSNVTSCAGEYNANISSSLPSICQPEVHQQQTNVKKSINNLGKGNGEVMKVSRTPVVSELTKDLQIIEPNVQEDRNHSLENTPSFPKTQRENGDKRSRVITVPVGMSNQGPVEVYREVHQYPAGAITTTIERRSYIGLSQKDSPAPSRDSVKKKKISKIRKSQKTDHFASNSSLGSESSKSCKSTSSVNTLVSESGSDLTTANRSHVSSKVSLNDTFSDAAGPISRSLLTASVMQMRQALEAIPNSSDNHSDKSYGGVECASNFSDTSSNLSTLSDLSGYEEEYVRIKRLVSDAVISPEDYKKMINKVNSKPNLTKTVPSVDYEKNARDLQAQKEDLEIQLHRLSIQVQNAVREKELYQQQLELMQTKVTETNQKQYFEVLKQRANLEGQLEMLKQELENSVYEKNKLQTKILESQKECEASKTMADLAKEAELQMKARLDKYEVANRELEVNVSESEKKLEKISKDYELAMGEVKDLHGKMEGLEILVDKLRDSESQLLGEVKSVRCQVLQLQGECQSMSEALAHAESSASKSTAELQACQTSTSWYQDQLQVAQNARSGQQEDLLQARASLAKVTSEKEALETKVQTLTREAEDGQARAVREKASLVAHLEALQADMAEREAMVSQLERDRGTDTRLMKDRQQRLEQDRQRIHKLRLDLTDAERQLDFARQDLKHKITLLARYEDELKDLRTSSAVNEEILRERDTRIDNFEKNLESLNVTLKEYQADKKEKEIQITRLKEEKLKLEVSLVAANSEKKEVDEAIMKVREDMTKLSSNFYRMKHDLAAKDRQNEIMTRESEEKNSTISSLEKKIEALEQKSKEREESKVHQQEIETLQSAQKEMKTEKERLDGELENLGRKYKTLEIEKKGLSDAVHLQEEQIHNMQGSQDNYREAILKKDEELYVARENYAALERTCVEMRRNWESLKEENLSLRQEAEALAEHEKLQKNEKADLKEGIQKERKVKQNLERKFEGLMKTYEEDKHKLLDEKLSVDKKLSDLTKELEKMNIEMAKAGEKKEQLEKNCSNLERELDTVKNEKLRAEDKVQDICTDLNKCKADLKGFSDAARALEVKCEALSTDNSNLKEKLTSLQTESEKGVTELKSLLELKSREMLSLQKQYSDKEASLAKLSKEKNLLISQVNSVLAENNHLKKASTKVSDNLVKESAKGPAETVSPNGKVLRGTEQLQKEIGTLWKKITDYEGKIKEINKQKESQQATIKNIKKDNYLLRAKVKEFETLKKKCSELESYQENAEEYASLKARFSEMESKLHTKCKEVLSLTHSLNEKTNNVQLLKQKEQDLITQVETLQTGWREAQTRLVQLDTDSERAREDISNYQQQLKILEGERDEWMAKFESLRDSIPERDTSRQPAVQLQPSSRQSFTPPQESQVTSSAEMKGKLAGNCVGDTLSYINNISQTPVSNGTEFNKTMTDLQEQVSLTSEALHTKEQHIHHLQHQLMSLRQEGTNSSTPQTSNSGIGEMVPAAVHSQHINELLEKIQNLKVSSNVCLNCHAQTTAQPRDGGESCDAQSLLDKISHLESHVNRKEEELQETQTKMSTTINEFREKQRRYESNVRLLTRKLKEHMKGRKSAEKEMQAEEENHQRLLNEEHQRYEVLRCRYLELEGQREKLEGEMRRVEGELSEVHESLTRTQEEASQHHNNTLTLQKEIGRLQENCKSVESLRQTLASTEEKLRERKEATEEIKKESETVRQELRESQAALTSITSKLQHMETERHQLHCELENAKASLKNVNQEMLHKTEEIMRLEQQVSQMEGSNTTLKESVATADSTLGHLNTELKKVREERQAVQEQLQDVEAQLQVTHTKVTALEAHIKVVEGEARVKQEEVRQAKEHLTCKEERHQAQVAQLERSVSQAGQEIAALTTQLTTVQQERLSYQTQTTQLRTALQSTLTQLKSYKVEEETRSTEETTETTIDLPSPAPLDLEEITQLMERSVQGSSKPAPLVSLQSCLSSLRAEVNTLQSQLQHKAQQAAKELSVEGTSREEGETTATAEVKDETTIGETQRVKTV
ncbi:hypothetical protein Pcinc_019848 [Petrolisthes cinctipes]|uniref:Uncharacterized protein n=1 Tax=Petrolisthes cinctipes TaxID=88211 RepID=A0AAE1FJA7_PETCI|nr:hypothetical protein Pcinc_019848 [Petrolisthes cinctipes]